MEGSKLDRRGIPDSLGGSRDIPQEGRRTIKVNRGRKQSLVAKRGVKGTKEEKEQEKRPHLIYNMVEKLYSRVAQSMHRRNTTKRTKQFMVPCKKLF